MNGIAHNFGRSAPFDLWYILKHRKVFHCTLFEANAFLSAPHLKKIRRHYLNGWKVSTVFLSLDHRSQGTGAPVVFETMVFDPDGNSRAFARCTTHREALKLHRAYKKAVLEKQL